MRQPGLASEDELVGRETATGKVAVLGAHQLSHEQVELPGRGDGALVHGLGEELLQQSAVTFAAPILPRRVGVCDVLEGGGLLDPPLELALEFAPAVRDQDLRRTEDPQPPVGVSLPDGRRVLSLASSHRDHLLEVGPVAHQVQVVQGLAAEGHREEVRGDDLVEGKDAGQGGAAGRSRAHRGLAHWTGVLPLHVGQDLGLGVGRSESPQELVSRWVAQVHVKAVHQALLEV
eukprot:9541437-Lingulodinium_polyedra.AAC.2